MIKFTESHEWILENDGIGIVGVTDYAQKELGEIVYVELPKIGKHVHLGEEAAVLESTKAAADVYTPVSGTILEVNEQLSSRSELVNQSPEELGWIFKLKLSDPDELEKLLNKEAYSKKIKQSS